MTKFRSAIALFVVAGCGSSGAHFVPDGATVTDAGVRDGSAGPVVLTGTPIVASAALGTGESLLGTTTDSQFNQVNGDALFAPRSDGSGNTHTTVNQVTLGWVEAQNTNDIAANLGGWGLGSAALSASNTTRYMSMRAYTIDYYEDVDLTMPETTATGTAVYFVSKIYYGHSFEELFTGSSSTFTAAVAAQLPQATGSISATAMADNLTAMDVGRGLTPTNGMALFSTNPSDVSTNYTASGPSVPIYIEYRLIPGASEPPGTSIPWVSANKATIAIDEIDVFHNGSFLDHSNTAWQVAATCKINGAQVSQDDQVWTQSSVTAGGTDVNTDGSGPQDPNTGDPTSDYGRYASLPFAKQFPVNNGNTLECDLGGSRTDPSTPVPLPNITITVPVDITQSPSGYVGNYDSGNDLDYVVHYSVTYSAN